MVQRPLSIVHLLFIALVFLFLGSYLARRAATPSVYIEQALVQPIDPIEPLAEIVELPVESQVEPTVEALVESGVD